MYDIHRARGCRYVCRAAWQRSKGKGINGRSKAKNYRLTATSGSSLHSSKLANAGERYVQFVIIARYNSGIAHALDLGTSGTHSSSRGQFKTRIISLEVTDLQCKRSTFALDEWSISQ